MRNERLIANAGSGKTYALTTRMIQLLARGVEPRKIAALTFTRKSAGEFLCALFERLAEAALDPKKLAELQTKEHLKDLDTVRCRSLLGKLASQIGCLGMGTIDSLFARIARAFPLESGLAEDFAMAGESEIQAARERTLAVLFETESSASLSDFIDLLRRINRTHGERDVFENLLRESKNLHGKFLATPHNVTWGDASAIWDVGCDILNAGKVSPAADAFLQAVLETHEDFSDEAEKILRANLESLRSFDSGGTWNREISNFVKGRLCAEPTSGSLRITPKKEGWLNLNTRVRAARLDLLHAALKPEFESLLQRSRSLHFLMQKFEDFYARLVRSTGLVTFADITDSLARKSADVDWNASAGYRIDQTFEHWLLDEFQDTSRPQWKILKNFIDEVVMDPGQGRSFFYVGDTKQAIYSWRGGDPDLFFEIFDAYTPAIEDARPLTESWRSCNAILDFVNKVFGDLDPLQSILEIPVAAAEKWASAWSNHTASPKTRDIKGYAEWVSVPKNDGEDEEQGDAQDRKVLEILEANRAWERGLSCAVLKRDNNGVASLAALLQSKGIPVAVEGRTNPCVDNPLGAALMAALRVVASPDDKLSLAVAQGYPALAAWGVGDWNFRNQALASLAQSGFAATIRQWIDSTNLEAEPFLKERAAAFLLAAEEFDACRKSSDGITDFLRFIENRQTQENEAIDVVRIMTVHQSKGLGFDMVIVSGLDKKSGGNDGSKLALGPSAREVKWGALLPAKDFAEQDDVLRKQIEIQEADDKYGEICTAYVALTRAKKALYVVTNELGENTKAKNFARHLALQFGTAPVQFGDFDWFKAYQSRAPEQVGASVHIPFRAPLYGTPKPASPSSFKAESTTGSGSAGISIDAAELGTEVHEALAGIEWMESTVLQMDLLSREAADLVRGFLEKPIAKEVFTKPQSQTDLWRERAFDVMLEGQWVSGVFDRVVVHRSKNGVPDSAIIYDFKTDHGSPAEIEERYAGQMEVYRKAVCSLLQLSPDCVKAQILCIR
jgi:ATP-dependent exoDNAse (exonuclease V) beta subunit